MTLWEKILNKTHLRSHLITWSETLSKFNPKRSLLYCFSLLFIADAAALGGLACVTARDSERERENVSDACAPPPVPPRRRVIAECFSSLKSAARREIWKMRGMPSTSWSSLSMCRWSLLSNLLPPEPRLLTRAHSITVELCRGSSPLMASERRGSEMRRGDEKGSGVNPDHLPL